MDHPAGEFEPRDRETFNRFLAKHRDRLRDWVGFRLGAPHGRGADPSDALQDVSVKIWQSAGRFDGATELQLLNWFQRHLRWWVVDFSRKKVLRGLRRRESRTSSGDEASPLDRLPADSSSPSRLAGQSEKEALIRSAGEALTNEQLAILTLHDVDGVALREIALQFGASAIDVARQYLSGTIVLRDFGVVLQDSTMDPQDAPLQARLACAIQRLPAGERQAVLLKHLEEYTMEEVAETLETTPAAVGSAVYRGMKALRTMLAKTPFEGERGHVGGS